MIVQGGHHFLGVAMNRIRLIAMAILIALVVTSIVVYFVSRTVAQAAVGAKIRTLSGQSSKAIYTGTYLSLHHFIVHDFELRGVDELNIAHWYLIRSGGRVVLAK